MKIKRIVMGFLATNCYILTDEKTGCAAVIDPALYTEELSAELERIGAENVKYVLLTHPHHDHILGVDKTIEATGARLAIHKLDAPALNSADTSGSANKRINRTIGTKPDLLLSDGDVINLGELSIAVMHTPGHTAGSACYICEDVIFAGDTLFYLNCGRCDLPTGNYAAMLGSLARLAALPGDYTVYPGHDVKTTLDFERRNNEYMREGIAGKA
ncbi:MAG: MBL fold metallo-hydrolase [Oscillospiraceae bacterium]|jgi:glyoxylase-like metal-dependent hydrolase (beta-lactamase superfamily II)|nr:MBL fold metallo-hydrolase [Oscillospiraceae bacterium]